jgi:hypothetical protein
MMEVPATLEPSLETSMLAAWELARVTNFALARA